MGRNRVRGYAVRGTASTRRVLCAARNPNPVRDGTAAPDGHISVQATKATELLRANALVLAHKCRLLSTDPCGPARTLPQLVLGLRASEWNSRSPNGVRVNLFARPCARVPAIKCKEHPYAHQLCASLPTGRTKLRQRSGEGELGRTKELGVT